ncbi:helix-turn-helix domain-containing protein [Dietzia maris]|uniref:Helix-turn-helix domain-containing protein n=1 Tax=Dietzia maris TaxID=37915 RepID=A0AAE4R0S4_9ACTN|nr:helix-turn-helix domain-containing protein [Dietzia maris]MDV6299467.1 helix-turn-helix domain-containing protein [Dietzia maris]
MPRPRVHDLDQLLDAAERLAAESGAAAVTVRALSDLTGVSNGAIYHAFGSRAGLVGRAWLRAARRFLDLQRDMVEAVLAGGDPSEAAADAVVAAADAPAQFVLDHPSSGRFLLTVRRSDLLGSADLPADVAAELRELDHGLTDLFVMLSRALWGRADRASVDVIRDCVVELPNALLLRGRRAPTPVVRDRITVCVRAVLALGPPAASPPPTASPPTAPPPTDPPTPHNPTTREDHP